MNGKPQPASWASPLDLDDLFEDDCVRDGSPPPLDPDAPATTPNTGGAAGLVDLFAGNGAADAPPRAALAPPPPPPRPLEDYAAGFGLRVVDPSSGSMFDAVSTQLGIAPASVRERVVAWLQQHGDDVWRNGLTWRKRVTVSHAWDAYLDGISRGVHNDELALQAVCMAFDVSIVVLDHSARLRTFGPASAVQRVLWLGCCVLMDNVFVALAESASPVAGAHERRRLVESAAMMRRTAVRCDSLEEAIARQLHHEGRLVASADVRKCMFHDGQHALQAVCDLYRVRVTLLGDRSFAPAAVAAADDALPTLMIGRAGGSYWSLDGSGEDARHVSNAVEKRATSSSVPTCAMCLALLKARGSDMKVLLDVLGPFMPGDFRPIKLRQKGVFHVHVFLDLVGMRFDGTGPHCYVEAQKLFNSSPKIPALPKKLMDYNSRTVGEPGALFRRLGDAGGGAPSKARSKKRAASPPQGRQSHTDTQFRACAVLWFLKLWDLFTQEMGIVKDEDEKSVKRVLADAVKWCADNAAGASDSTASEEPLESIEELVERIRVAANAADPDRARILLEQTLNALALVRGKRHAPGSTSGDRKGGDDDSVTQEVLRSTIRDTVRSGDVRMCVVVEAFPRELRDGEPLLWRGGSKSVVDFMPDVIGSGHASLFTVFYVGALGRCDVSDMVVLNPYALREGIVVQFAGWRAGVDGPEGAAVYLDTESDALALTLSDTLTLVGRIRGARLIMAHCYEQVHELLDDNDDDGDTADT